MGASKSRNCDVCFLRAGDDADDGGKPIGGTAEGAERIGPYPLSLIQPHFRTGDILLFNTKRVAAKITRVFTDSHWDHVAIVLVGYTVPDENDIDERTGAPRREPCYRSLEAVRSGVQTFPLDAECLNTHPGSVCWRRLVVDSEVLGYFGSRELLCETAAKLFEFFHEVNGRPCERNVVELLHAAGVCSGKSREKDCSTLFCSELVAEGLIRAGLQAESGRMSNMYVPSDFSSSATSSREFKLRKGVSFGPEVMLDCSPKAQHKSIGESGGDVKPDLAKQPEIPAVLQEIFSLGIPASEKLKGEVGGESPAKHQKALSTPRVASDKDRAVYDEDRAEYDECRAKNDEDNAEIVEDDRTVTNKDRVVYDDDRSFYPIFQGEEP